jgi:hypothetical protein
LHIPNADRAVIESAKLYAYLLSRNHPIGRFKATFFLTLGYSSDNWQQMEADLRRQPSGRSAEVVSVWVVRTGEDFPRFVTAYPGG